MEFPYGILLIVLSIGSLICGVAIAVIGGMLRFNQVQFINEFLANRDTSGYKATSEGMIVAPNKIDEIDLGHTVALLSILTILTGTLVIIYSLVGIMSGILKNVSLLFLFIGSVLVSTMLQFLLIWMVIDGTSAIHDPTRNQLAKAIGDSYQLGPDANKFSKMMNSIMIVGYCCGVVGPNDFLNLTYADETGVHSLKVSPACCNSKVWQGTKQTLLNCAKSLDKRNINTMGCYESLYNIAWENSIQSYVIVLGILIAWQVLAVAVAVLLLFQPKDEEKMEAGQPYHEEAPMDAEKRTFTPFSKLSSAQTADVNRMRSTEIW